jgi:hypothetical protein
MQRADALRAHALLTRLSSRLEGPLRRAYDNALATMLARADFSQVEALLARGDVGAAITTLLDAGRVPAQSILRAQFGAMLDAGAAITLRTGANVIVGKHFSNIIAGSPRAAAAMDRLQLQFFPPIFNDTEKVLRKVFARGLAQGLNPRAVARDARSYVGLTEYDYGVIGTFDLALRSGDYQRVLQRELRDRRFDKLLVRADRDGRQLTSAEIAPQVQRYAERLQKWRGETWSRSAALNAARESQLVAWEEAADAAQLAPNEVIKTWITMMDGRERPEHGAANGISVPMDAEFPVAGGVQTPGEGEFNCRCTFTVRVVPRNAKSREKFFISRKVVQTTEDKYIYPPHILTPEQKKAYRATQRKLAKRGGGGLPPAPAPKPLPPPKPRTIYDDAIDRVDRLTESPFAGKKQFLEDIVDSNTLPLYDHVWADRYTVPTTELRFSAKPLQRTDNAFERDLIKQKIREVEQGHLTGNRPVIVQYDGVPYIASGHQELIALQTLDPTAPVDVHFLNLDLGREALKQGASLDQAVNAVLDGKAWIKPIAIPPSPRPPGGGGKIVYPAGMTDPEERKRYRAKLRRMAKQGITSPTPTPKPITYPRPATGGTGGKPGSWGPDGKWIRTKAPPEPGPKPISPFRAEGYAWQDAKRKYDKWIVENEWRERFAELPEATLLRETYGMNVNVGDRRLGNAYGHFSYSGGETHIAIKPDIERFKDGVMVRNVDMVKEVAYHETGHAVDYHVWGPRSSYTRGSSGFWSDSNEFIVAFNEDRNASKTEATIKIGYSSVPDPSGRKRDTGWVQMVLYQYGYQDGASVRRELVADLYAILHGAEVRQGNIRTQDVLAQFPRIVKMMKKKMGIK